jgi:hypothetical protein
MGTALWCAGYIPDGIAACCPERFSANRHYRRKETRERNSKCHEVRQKISKPYLLPAKTFFWIFFVKNTFPENIFTHLHGAGVK